MPYYNLNSHEYLKERFNEKFPDVKVCDVVWGSWYCHHYIQFIPKGYPNLVHFEYRITQYHRQGVLELHIEPTEKNREIYRKIGIQLMHLTADKNIDAREYWNIPFGSFRFKDRYITDIESFVAVFKDFYEIVDPIIRKLLKANKEIKLQVDYPKQDVPYIPMREDDEEVSVGIKTLEEVMNLNLALPDYQREYCWEDKNITDLWSNLLKIQKSKPFHLGTIILHDFNGHYDIIDGQQRLITLSIILLALGYDNYLPLLNATYDSQEALNHVANCKYVVQTLVAKEKNQSELLKRIREEVSFAVLVVNEANLDLAYTFFSNQNSKGVPLSDFDLLKAHHLRFIPNVGQAEHMAVKWNRISQQAPVYKEKNALYRALGTHIYRLRKWMRKSDSQENAEHHILYEYQSAPTMPDVPPFGEKFDFYEKIQGGTHFFVYAETFIHRYNDFIAQPIVDNLHRNLAWGPYEIFADTIETLLFAYYLKFGNQYLTEALYCIAQLMALHRYNSGRVAGDGTGVRHFANENEITLMIDQASSPTFFLAESIEKHSELSQKSEYPISSGIDLPEMRGVRYGIYKALKNIFHEAFQGISESVVKNKILEEYGR